MVNGSDQMAAGAKEILDESVYREKPLRLLGGLKPAHLPFTLAGPLMRHLRSIVLVLLRAVYDGRHHGAMRRRVTPQLVGD